MTTTEGVVACETCLKEIPRSVAQSHEGADYTYHFCGGECYERWRTGASGPAIGVAITGAELDFETAELLARALARRPGEEEPMLLAWFDRKSGRASPDIPECQHLPSWLAYAQGHGSNLRVDINRGEYVFAFRRD